MPASWERDPFGRNQYRWFDGSVWTDHVSNNGRVSSDPIPSTSANPPRDNRGANNQPVGKKKDGKPVGMIGELAGIGAGYAVLVYLGIPSGLALFFFPPLGIVMCGLTFWLAARARRRVRRATQRGVEIVAARLAQFIAEYRSYESKWGSWTPPDSDGPPRNFGGNQRSGSSGGQERQNNDPRDFSGNSFHQSPSAHEVLGVREGASPVEVRAAFHKLMLAVHPDRHTDKSPEERARLEDQAKVITEAYNALKK
jgi:DnaJ-domain-containing protein 1